MSCSRCSRSLAIALVTFAAACGAPAAPPARTTPVPKATATALPPAPSGAPGEKAPAIAAQPVALPGINHATLPNGLNVWHVGSRTIPTVHVRLVVRSGQDKPAVGRLTALAVERSLHVAPVPGAPKPATPPLQTEVGIETPAGAAIFSVDVPRDLLEPAFDLLGGMIKQAKLETAPIALLRSADSDRMATLARTDPATLVRYFAAADLAGVPAPGSEDVSRILPVDLKAFHKTWYTPRTMGVVVTGDVTFDEAMEAARRAFGSWDVPAPQTTAAAAPAAAQYTRVVVLDRPQSTDAAVIVAAPGAAVGDPAWPSLWLLQELMTNGATADSCSDSSIDLVSARVSGVVPPITACFQPPADKVSATVAFALERARALSKTAPSDPELQAARNAWNDRLATRLASVPAVADFAASALSVGMAHDAPSRFVSQLKAVPASDVLEAAKARLSGGTLVIVAADASRTADELSRFGDVVVLDPFAGFARKRHIPANPNAATPQP